MNSRCDWVYSCLRLTRDYPHAGLPNSNVQRMTGSDIKHPSGIVSV